MSNMIAFFVPGIPVPQGSKIIAKSGTKTWLRDANGGNLRAWRDHVSVAARAESEGVFEAGVEANLSFVLPRPKTVKRLLPWVKPDLDKLTRAVFDALTTAGVWRDDCQAVSLTASKTYGPMPGVLIELKEAA